ADGFRIQRAEQELKIVPFHISEGKIRLPVNLQYLPAPLYPCLVRRRAYVHAFDIQVIIGHIPHVDTETARHALLDLRIYRSPAVQETAPVVRIACCLTCIPLK